MMQQLKPVTDDVIRVSQNDELVKKDVALAAAARDRNQRSSAMYTPTLAVLHTELYYT